MFLVEPLVSVLTCHEQFKVAKPWSLETSPKPLSICRNAFSYVVQHFTKRIRILEGAQTGWLSVTPFSVSNETCTTRWKKFISWFDTGQYEESALYLRITLAAVEEQYGRYSIEMANELQKFTDVLMEMAKERRDPQVLQELEHHLKEAALIYEIHYGVWSKSFKEIQTKLRGLCQ